jgi:hypothetical protein
MIAAFVTGLASGCADRTTTCRSARSCIDVDGTFGLCARNRCAFVDHGCATGYRWDDSAGELAGLCVDGSDLPDAAIPDARPRDAPP